MYNAFFGFDADPFRVNPDPAFLHLSETHQEALATLDYAIRDRKGFVVLTGEVGTGKTTILNAMLQRLDPGTKVAYLFNTALSVEDLFTYLFNEFELEPIRPFKKLAALNQLNEFLIERHRRDLRTLLILDEAQNLSVDLLEEIRMLSNLETPQSKLLQIMLVGQPELASTLDRPELRQLRQRVELRHTILPLGPGEVGDYVRERLLTAGHEDGRVFSPGAIGALHQLSQGVPRVVNVLCDNALITAFARDSHKVSKDMVRDAAVELGLIEASGPPSRDRLLRKMLFWRGAPTELRA